MHKRWKGPYLPVRREGQWTCVHWPSFVSVTSLSSSGRVCYGGSVSSNTTCSALAVSPNTPGKSGSLCVLGRGTSTLHLLCRRGEKRIRFNGSSHLFHHSTQRNPASSFVVACFCQRTNSNSLSGSMSRHIGLSCSPIGVDNSTRAPPLFQIDHKPVASSE